MAIDLSHAGRDGMNPLKNKQWIGIRGEPEVEAGLSNPGKGPFLRKQGNAAKHAAK
jgi:hypothetical protein